MSLQIQKTIRSIIIIPIRFYQRFISPILPKSCLYEPSCSEYTLQSIIKFGIIKGFILGITRIFRCNGWFFMGGKDPVPERFTFQYIKDSYREFHRKK